VIFRGRQFKLFPECVKSLIRAARQARLQIEVVIADWPDVPQLAPLSAWLAPTIGPLPYRVLPMDGPFNKGRGLNAAGEAAASDNLFFLDADMIVPGALLTRGLAWLSAGKAWFPGFTGREGNCPRATGNLFIRREAWRECGRHVAWDNRRGSDWAFAQAILARGLSAEPLEKRRPVPGFSHIWHPKTIGWRQPCFTT
jgi:hypothetical protein